MELSIAATAAWSAQGPGPGAVARALTAGTPPAARHDPPSTPPPGVLDAHGFDLAAELGTKGTRSMDRATGLAVCATARLLAASGGDVPRDRSAVIIGTTNGSLGTILDFTETTYTAPKPYLVNPARFPVTVMNYAAGQCAIRHGVTGPNITLAGGRNAVALAFIYAARLIRAGRADDVLCGATEEYTSRRAWLEWRARPPGAVHAPVAEGCVMFHLTAARPGRAAVLAVATATGGRLAECLTTALRRAGVEPGEVWAAAGNGALDGCHDGESRAHRAVLGTGPRRVEAHTAVGDTSAASVGFQVLALLELAATDPAAAGRAAVTTSIDRHGLATAVVLRCPR
ncbi:3-oxoacyl-ACP synthase [Actinorhabdospora filicis]|uniref:3-oxoacyl-ACP synthase n=1 Tax=Actinorhabdospora filicis TaxID=1785913 RepID=A0A9W6SIS1_9ACTN|nr:beta-ketoacyl synthase N-terminal-like domain-containing protein [Actinorhabdospora filicis]GLZ77834.1 3-oxoacyl-ACP synthase [Actinorhabdospora filicis]